jgi:iron complex transport system permease protein
MLLRPAELPLGVVMAIVGAPLFLHMVVRRGGG